METQAIGVSVSLEEYYDEPNWVIERLLVFLLAKFEYEASKRNQE